MTGWISLHRKIQDHWIWQDPIKLRWWLDILLTVNTAEAKVKIGNDFYVCQRGESLLSLQSWGERWRTSKDAVRNFFTLLEKDHMINRVNLTKTTRLTVCNYDSYQIPLHVKPTHSQRVDHPNNKEDKDNKDNNLSKVDIIVENSSNFQPPPPISEKPKRSIWIEKFDERKEKFKKELSAYANVPPRYNGPYPFEMIKEFFEYWNEPNKSRSRMRWETQSTWDTAKRLATWSKNEHFNNRKKTEEQSYTPPTNLYQS